MRPLKQPDSGSIVDPLLVDEMFYQIPEILEHHEHFLEQVANCVSQWHDRQTVGNILMQSVSCRVPHLHSLSFGRLHLDLGVKFRP